MRYKQLTAERAVQYGLYMAGEQAAVGDGSEGQVAAHVATELAVTLVQETHRDGDRQLHHSRARVVLQTQANNSNFLH